MERPNPEPDNQPRPPDFLRFQQTLKRLMAVSKAELDQLRDQERRKKRPDTADK